MRVILAGTGSAVGKTTIATGIMKLAFTVPLTAAISKVFCIQSGVCGGRLHKVIQYLES